MSKHRVEILQDFLKELNLVRQVNFLCFFISLHERLTVLDGMKCVFIKRAENVEY